MRKFLLSLVSIFALATYVGAETYTYTLVSGDLKTDAGTYTLGEYEWTVPACDFVGFDSPNGRGFQIGSANKPSLTYSISSSDFSEYTINSITIKSSTASNSDAKMTIKVGDSESDPYTLTTKATDYKFDCAGAQGDVVISWEQTTSKALYLHTITIDYTLPAGMVEVPTPVFSVASGVYPDQVKISVETENQSAKLYYTLDGTDPSFEDYTAGIGSTMRSSYYIMEKTFTETTTVKVIAVVEDGGMPYSSKIAEATYTILPGVAYVPATEIVSGSKYGFIVVDGIANPVADGKKYDYLEVTDTTIVDNYVKDIENNSFTFTAVAGGYTIQDASGKYLYKNSDTYNNFNVATEMPDEGAVWTVAIDNDGKATIVNVLTSKTIYYSPQYSSYGCYPEDKVTDDMILPSFYMMRVIPEAVITPAPSSVLDDFQTVTITCPQGIKPGEGFTAVATDGTPVAHGGWSYDMTVTQVDANTITLSTAEPITGNKNFWVQFTGSLYMDPGFLDMEVQFPRFGLSYSVKEEVPAATIEEITPANNSVVEKLSYVLFSFSYYASASDDATLQPKLYKEGANETLFAVEYTTKKEDGNGYVDMMDGALKVVEPIVANGTYILDIPTGYFVDANGGNIEGVTLKYTVQNDGTGIEDVVIGTADAWIVYNVLGVKVMETTDASDLNTLAKGVYIINGVKRVIR